MNMYRHLAVAFFLLLNISLMAQRSLPHQALSDPYAEKAMRQHSTGWTLLGTGVIVSAVGISWTIGEVSYYNHTVQMAEASQSKITEKPRIAPKILAGSGLALMAASIPFFISENSNFRKSAMLSFQPAPTLLPSGRWVQYQQQGISLRLPFPKAD